MSSIGGVPPVSFQTISTHSPLGKPAVGLESVIEKDSPLPPVEESEEAERLRHRDVVVKLREDDAQHQHDQQSTSDDDQSRSQDQADREHNAEQALEAQLNPAAQTAHALPIPALYQARHLSEFEQNILPPGSLLDQQV